MIPIFQDFVISFRHGFSCQPGSYEILGESVSCPPISLPSFRLTDWLGTLRATTDSYGVAQGTCSGLPFGDPKNACQGNIPDNRYFTGKERDAESGNDYFGARYYSSAMGRFMSPDWSAKVEPVPYAKMDDPQSLNLYAYVQNNPLTNRDADGHWCVLGWVGTSCKPSVMSAQPEANSEFSGPTADIPASGHAGRECPSCDLRRKGQHSTRPLHRSSWV